MDCSIRKSAGQCSLTAHRSLSQLTTSFFGSQCQGIRPALFFALPFAIILRIIWFWLLVVFTRLDSSYIVCMVSRVVSVIDLSITNFVVSSFALHLLFSFQGTFAASFGVCSSSEQIWKDNFFFYLLKSALNWWAQVDSNHRPHDYQSCALASWAMGPCVHPLN